MSQLQAQGINSTLQLDSLGMRRFNLGFCCYDFGYRFRRPGFCCFPLCLADTYVRHGLGQFDLGGSEFSQQLIGLGLKGTPLGYLPFQHVLQRAHNCPDGVGQVLGVWGKYGTWFGKQLDAFVPRLSRCRTFSCARSGFNGAIR